MSKPASYYIGRPNTVGRVCKFKDTCTDVPAAIEKIKANGFLIKQVREPSMKSLEKWTFDSVCKSVGGVNVEPDGFDHNGYPSWLLVKGLI